MKIPVFINILLLIVLVNISAQNKITILDLQYNFHSNPIGVGSGDVNLSWKIQSDRNNVSQKAYRLVVANNTADLVQNKNLLWDSEKVPSNNTFVSCLGNFRIKPETRYYWKVKVWDNFGNESDWSEISTWQTGLFTSAEWGKASWIGYEELPDSMIMYPGIFGYSPKLTDKWRKRTVIPLFRKEFNVTKKISSAVLYVSGLGQFEAYINGKMLGNSFLQPGWTAYDKTVLYETFDITANLVSGKNAIGVIVGNGFFNINRERYRKIVLSYGAPRLICRLSVRYTDGTFNDIVSGSDWETTPSPITFSTLYGGEDYDARIEQPGWNQPGFNAKGWKSALLVKPPAGLLKPDEGENINVAEIIPEKKLSKITDSIFIYDFGQNASGIVSVKVKGLKGQRIKLIPAELLTTNGTVNQKATGSPYYYSYILKGTGIEEWKPRFTYYGFRYVQVEGAMPETAKSGGLPQIVDIKFLHTRNAAANIGSFECSNELFNRIYTLINWAIKSNLQHVVTDCPHREKLGWLEQTYLMGEGIHYNFDIYHLYKKLIGDMKDAQTPEGLVPTIVPEYILFDAKETIFRDSPEWGSASIMLPWLLYRWYGDESILAEAWPMMEKYIYYLKGKSKNHILSFGLGDWYDMGPNRPGFVQLTPVELPATATYYSDLKIVSLAAKILNKTQEAEYFSLLSDSVKKVFNSKFFNPQTNIYSTGSQTAMAIPLCTGLVNEASQKFVIKNLVDSIIAGNKKLTAGDIGFHYLVHALWKNGASQLLFDMNNRDDVPGYGFQLKKGATALTESWPALEVVSNNHLMLGHIMEWFYSGIGGISQSDSSIAFKDLVIKPEIIGDITFAKTGFYTPQGMVNTEWKKKEGVFYLKIEIPANAKASVYYPYTTKVNVTVMPGKGKDVQELQVQDGKTLFRVGSGIYMFSSQIP
jgi:alpha-L-rhamnosidase